MKPECLIINPYRHYILDSFLESNIKELFEIIRCKECEEVKNTLRTKSIKCIIYIIGQDLRNAYFIIQYAKDHFPLIPTIALINENNNLELARECGSLGINNVISLNNKELLQNTLKQFKSEKNHSNDLTELNIIIEKYPQLIQKALRYMQERFVSIMSTKEIADYMDISESYLSQVFNKECLPSPKKLLMCIKVNQAVKLMHNKGLKINEIAILSGFSNVHRFIDCFKRVYQKSPSEFREELLVEF